MAAKKMLEKHKDVARIDQESKRTHGWYVRVRFMGKTHSKFFSDGKYGGRYSSLLASLAWRDQTEISLGKVRTDRHIVTVSNTKTGVVGVRLNDQLNRYEVSWVNTEGKQGKTSVSIRKHGKQKAFELAGQIRQQKEAERLGLKKPAPVRGKGKLTPQAQARSAAKATAKGVAGTKVAAQTKTAAKAKAAPKPKAAAKPKAVPQKAKAATKPKTMPQKAKAATKPKAVPQKAKAATKPKAVPQKTKAAAKPKAVNGKGQSARAGKSAAKTTASKTAAKKSPAKKTAARRTTTRA